MSTYQMDYDFFTRVEEEQCGVEVTLTVSGVGAYEATREFLRSLREFSPQCYGRGGWCVYDVDKKDEPDIRGSADRKESTRLVFRANGQDVTSAIEDATELAYQTFAKRGLDCDWETDIR
ncbi:MAG: hypothetical protein SOW59_04545 [Corynebacterium sp.]|nr:hypothetical protein [Corynebacterium sp.]